MSKPTKSLPCDPSLRIDTFSLWVLGRQFPDSNDSWDGNWLHVVAACTGVGSRVEVAGPILDIVSFSTFHSQVEAMAASLSGCAELSSVEPELKLVLSYKNSLGHIKGELKLTADQFLERHSFTLSLDQTFLPEMLKELREILRQYPVIGERV